MLSQGRKGIFSLFFLIAALLPSQTFAYSRSPGGPGPINAPVNLTWEAADGSACDSVAYWTIILYDSSSGKVYAPPFQPSGPQTFGFTCANNIGDACSYPFHVTDIYEICNDPPSLSGYVGNYNQLDVFDVDAPAPLPSTPLPTTTLIIGSMGITLWDMVSVNIALIVGIVAAIGLIMYFFGLWKR